MIKRGSMKLNIMTLSSGLVAMILSGCTSLGNEVASAQTHNLTKKMPDGSILHYDTNVTPTPDWGCTTVGTNQSYDWDTIQTEGQFSFSGPYGLLVDKAIDYLTVNDLKANYVDLIIPTSHTLSFSDSANSYSSYDMNSNSQAVIAMYNCQKINPDLKVGATQGTDIGIGVGAGANTMSNSPMP